MVELPGTRTSAYQGRHEITFDDPIVYTKPFTIKVTHLLQAGTDILEYFCTENEKDQIHLVNVK